MVRTSDTIIQRRQLPLLGAYVEPRSPTERTLAEIWRRAFDMDCVGIADSYVDLGGDSLLAASIFAEMETSFGLKLPLALLVEADTIEQLARRVESLQQQVK